MESKSRATPAQLKRGSKGDQLIEEFMLLQSSESDSKSSDIMGVSKTTRVLEVTARTSKGLTPPQVKVMSSMLEVSDSNLMTSYAVTLVLRNWGIKIPASKF